MFAGVHTAIATPFKNGKLDASGLARIVEHQIAGGITGVVPIGTTGESSTVTDAERIEAFHVCVEAAAGRCKVIAGVGTNNTAQSIALAKAAKAAGADGGLVITPYYNKPTQGGLVAHTTAIADAIDLPVVMYNVPSRTSISYSLETVTTLAKHSNIVALKEATSDMAFAARIIRATAGKLTLLSGDDITALPLWSVGGRGVISVISNLVPARMVALWRAFVSGDLERARQLHFDLIPLMDGMFIESNPGPIKALMALRDPGLSADVRLPLVPVEAATLTRLKGICAELDPALRAELGE